MVFAEPQFVYSDKIEEITPLTLNLTFSKKDNDTITLELRKKANVKLNEESSKSFWMEFFSRSLEGKTVKANIIIVFRDKFGSACKLKEIGLLKKGTKINTD